MGESYSCESGGVIAAGRSYDPPIWTVDTPVANGIWTWFTDPRAVYRNGSVYIGWVNSSGTCGITKFTPATGVSQNFSLSSIGLEVDDHNNTAVHFLPDGRVMAIYGQHNDYSGLRYRISAAPEDISAWGTEQIVTVTTPYTYSNPHYLSQTGKTYFHYRSGAGGVGTNPMNVRAFDGTTWDSERAWLTETGRRPYVKSCNNGLNRIDFLITDMHPNQGTSSVYHFYMQLDGSVEKFYKSDGTLIGTGPVTPADCTRIHNGWTLGDGWVWDIKYGLDGHPRVLFTWYPSTTDHRYMYSRWSGSAWTAPVEITNAGTYLYSAEPNYSGGICFESKDANRVYLSKQVGSYWEIQEFATPDSGATWAKVSDITAGSTVRNCRPFSPRNHPYRKAVVWWSGTYTSYTSYNTSIKMARKQ